MVSNSSVTSSWVNEYLIVRSNYDVIGSPFKMEKLLR